MESWKGFLCSTRVDLAEPSRLVVSTLQELHHVPIDMGGFGAQPGSAERGSKGNVAECDVFIGIYAFRYGYTPVDGGQSITEMEFDEAQRLGKRCLCYVAHERLRPSQVDESDGKLQRLAEFKARIDRELVRDVFEKYGDLPGPEDLRLTNEAIIVF